jgi:hypothetical protein
MPPSQVGEFEPLAKDLYLEGLARDYYITSVPADGGDGLAVGARPTENRSMLYRSSSEVAGMPIAPARFKLK